MYAMRNYRKTVVTALLAAGAFGLAGCDGEGGNSVDLPSDQAKTDQTDADQPEVDKAQGRAGTRDNPYPVGSTIKGKEWEVTINSVTLGANDAVAAENQFNDPPPEGKQYALVNITATYVGTESSTPWVTIKYVGADGSTASSYDASAVVPDEFNSYTELYQGGSATGNIALLVPIEAPETGALSVEPDMIGDKSFVAIQ
ncbi:MAG: hypothetical protein FWH11_03885 [Micrococcales bacterium]|nr:hypothetical protein [Micrococcales bacterium]